MKKMKKIIAAAIAMMSFSTAAAVTGTVAWFTANNLVSVGGMTVKAEAEQGIVVSNEGKSIWKTSADATHTGADLGFVPTSTVDTSAWYHGFSSDAANGQDYESIAAISPVDNVTTPASYGTAGDGSYGFLDNTTWKRVYLLNSFYIQSSSVNAINNQDIFVRDFSSTAASQQLSKALRVAVTKNGNTTNAKVIAPVAGATLTYQVGLTTAKASTTAIAAANTNVDTLVIDSNVNIPAYTSDGANALRYDVYVYFEGEDAACMSNNIQATLEALTVSFKFGNKTHVNP